MTNGLFGHYHRIRHWLRIKYWRGRNVHSPFMYSLVREAMLKRKRSGHAVDDPLFDFLTKKGIKRTHAVSICRIYSQLRLSGYTYGTDYGCGADLFVIPEGGTAEQCSILIGRIRQTLHPQECKCMIFLHPYRNRKHRQLWKNAVDASDAVALDLYHFGCLFFNKKVKKQLYKMKL